MHKKTSDKKTLHSKKQQEEKMEMEHHLKKPSKITAKKHIGKKK